MQPSKMALLALAFLIVSCSQKPNSNTSLPLAPPERQGEPIQTDALVYVLEKKPGLYDATATAIYTNTLGDTVYFNRCNTDHQGTIYHVERAAPDEDKPSFVGGVWGCGGGVPRGAVLPGATLRAEVWVGSTESPNAQPPIQPEERVGRFRITFELYSEPGTNDDFGNELPFEERRSNAFDIRFPD